ncbi:MAG: hypothetical protein ACTHMS_03950 [Jatrophihabitans sp.]|uniref:hypothetical protein n=1 Tax=Jatrophihabitans sp. TaxID=1932789 RepID=UPI003F7E9975
METWYDYRTVWAKHPLLAVYAGIVVVVFVLGIIGTFVTRNALAVCFVPALAGAYVHHLMVQKRLR